MDRLLGASRAVPRHRAGGAPRARHVPTRIALLATAAATAVVGAVTASLVTNDAARAGSDMRQELMRERVGAAAGTQPVVSGEILKRLPSVVVPTSGSGDFVVARTKDGVDVSAADLVYSVEVERPLAFPRDDVAAQVDATLRDRRGWARLLGLDLRRVDDAPALRILLATPATTDALCAPLDTQGQVSCRNGSLVVLNAARWAEAVPWYAADVRGYRTYLINHEVGHALGRGHARCPGPGRPAPVMQQQTYGLQGCTSSVWPLASDLS